MCIIRDIPSNKMAATRKAYVIVKKNTRKPVFTHQYKYGVEELAGETVAVGVPIRSPLRDGPGFHVLYTREEARKFRHEIVLHFQRHPIHYRHDKLKDMEIWECQVDEPRFAGVIPQTHCGSGMRGMVYGTRTLIRKVR